MKQFLMIAILVLVGCGKIEPQSSGTKINEYDSFGFLIKMNEIVTFEFKDQAFLDALSDKPKTFDYPAADDKEKNKKIKCEVTKTGDVQINTTYLPEDYKEIVALNEVLDFKVAGLKLRCSKIEDYAFRVSELRKTLGPTVRINSIKNPHPIEKLSKRPRSR